MATADTSDDTSAVTPARRRKDTTPLLQPVIDAYEGDYHTRVIVSPRRNGKSSAVALLAARGRDLSARFPKN